MGIVGVLLPGMGLVGAPLPGMGLVGTLLSGMGLVGTPLPAGGISVVPGVGEIVPLGFILSGDRSGVVGLTGADSLDGIPAGGCVASVAGFC